MYNVKKGQGELRWGVDFMKQRFPITSYFSFACLLNAGISQNLIHFSLPELCEGQDTLKEMFYRSPVTQFPQLCGFDVIKTFTNSSKIAIKC